MSSASPHNHCRSKSAPISSCRPRGMGEQVAVLVNCAPLHRHAIPDGGNRLVEPRRAVDDEELGPTQIALDEIVEDSRPGSVLSPPMLLIASSNLLPSARTPRTTRARSGRFAVEPHAHHRAVENKPHDGSSASERAFQASQSVCTLRHTRLTVSLPPRRQTAPERPAYPPCIGAGEIRARDHASRQACAAGKPQRLALPSVVLPGGVHLARGTAISIGPNVPVSDRGRLPWRCR